MASSLARQFYEKLLSQSDLYGFLTQLAQAKEMQESEWLEFKGLKDLKTGKDIHSDSIKGYWSEALSGFANSGGGVLILGIDARRGKNQIDTVQSPAMASDAKAIEGRLKELLIHACDPPVDGVEVRSACNGKEKQGFVVCYVPEGNHKPYRAELKGKTIFLRANDSFYIPSTSIWRSLFYPRTSPKFLPSLGTMRVPGRIEFNIYVVNTGSRTAKDLVFFVHHDCLSRIQDLKEPSISYNEPGIVKLECARPFHPGASLCLLHFEVDEGHIEYYSDTKASLEFVLEIYCEDFEAERWTCNYFKSEVDAFSLPFVLNGFIAKR